MRSKARWALPVIGPALVILLSFHPTPIHAQIVPDWDFSVSVFGGGAFPFDTDVGGTNVPTVLIRGGINVDPGRATGTFPDMQLNSSFGFGGKVGAWTLAFRAATGLDFGAEIDVTHFTPDWDAQLVTMKGQWISDRPQGGPAGSLVPRPGQRLTLSGSIPLVLPSFDIDATIVAVNVLTRVPLYQSPSFPNGRLQGYVGVGAGVETAALEISGVGSAQDTGFAFQALAGGKVFLTRHVALFAEYKFTHSSHSWNVQSTKIEADLNVNHVVGGLAFHF